MVRCHHPCLYQTLDPNNLVLIGWILGQVKELYQLSYDHFMTVQQRLPELGSSAAPELATASLPGLALEVKQLEHVVLRNRIALQIAHQAGPGDNLRVSFDFSYHPCFAVAIVKKS